jgi:hypothetical protein
MILPLPKNTQPQLAKLALAKRLLLEHSPDETARLQKCGMSDSAGNAFQFRPLLHGQAGNFPESLSKRKRKCIPTRRGLIPQTDIFADIKRSTVGLPGNAGGPQRRGGTTPLTQCFINSQKERSSSYRKPSLLLKVPKNVNI